MNKPLKFALKDIYLRTTGLLYRGSRLNCPICDTSFRKMKPHLGVYSLHNQMVDHYTEDAHCPTCNLDIRHRLFYQNFTNLLDHDNYSILHFAPEYRIYKNLQKRTFKDYIVADIDPDLYSTAQKIDATSISFEAGKFDFIVFNHILQFISDDDKALDELHRTLKVGGKLFITVPIYDGSTYDGRALTAQEREKKLGAPDHLRMYGLDFVEKLKKKGFTTQTVDLYETTTTIYNSARRSPHSDSDRYLFICQKI